MMRIPFGSPDVAPTVVRPKNGQPDCSIYERMKVAAIPPGRYTDNSRWYYYRNYVVFTKGVLSMTLEHACVGTVIE